MSDTRPAPRRLRSAAAVIAGFAVTFILSVGTDAVMHALGVFPEFGKGMSDGKFALAASYRVVFTILGGYVAARLAPHRPMAHAWALAWIGLAAGTLGLIAYFWISSPAMGPLWYSLSIPLSALPAVLTGGWLAVRRDAPATA